MLASETNTIGVLVDTLNQDYQRRIVAGILAEANTLGVSIRLFASKGAERGRETFDLCSSRAVSGLIVLSGTLASAWGMAGLSQYCARFRSSPICSIGGQLQGAVEVTVSTNAGIRDALAHLLLSSGRRRIAFIRGPRSNEEANRRFAAYRQSLAELELVHDDGLVVDGDFLESSGAAAVGTLLDTRRQAFDAIVAASDLMALGALEELTRRQVDVPGKVAVVGFDDIESARFAAPPLATVRQPSFEQGRRALREVVARLSESTLPSRVMLDTRFIPRASCGVRSLSSYVSELSPPQRAAGLGPVRFDDAYREALPDLLVELRAVLAQAGFDSETGLPETLVAQVATDIRGQRRGLLQGASFVSFIEQTARELADAPTSDMSAWQEVLTLLRRHLAPCLRDEPRLRQRAEDIWHQARTSISHVAERSQAQRWLAQAAVFAAVREAGGRMLAAPDLHTFASALAGCTSSLDIDCCFLALQEQGASHRGLVSIVGKQVELHPPGVFGPDQLTPPFGDEGAARPFAHIIKPLLWRDAYFGYVCFEWRPGHGRVYSALRDYASATLQAMLREGCPAAPEGQPG